MANVFVAKGFFPYVTDLQQFRLIVVGFMPPAAEFCPLAPDGPLWQCPRDFRAVRSNLNRPRSSGVEHSLGKGEVECSIHSVGTIFSRSVRPYSPVRTGVYPPGAQPSQGQWPIDTIPLTNGSGRRPTLSALRGLSLQARWNGFGRETWSPYCLRPTARCWEELCCSQEERSLRRPGVN